MTEPAPRPLPPIIRDVLEQRAPVRDVNTEVAGELSALDRVALWVTEHVGTMGFFLAILAWTVLWLGWNLLAPAPLRFDPPTGFVFWLFISNMIQILLMPLIMIGQNLQSRHAELRAERDLEVNIQAEREIKVILEHLEYQNALLLELAGRRKDPAQAAAPGSAAADAGSSPP